MSEGQVVWSPEFGVLPKPGDPIYNNPAFQHVWWPMGVNFIRARNSPLGQDAQFLTEGEDDSVGLNVIPKGAGKFNYRGNEVATLPFPGPSGPAGGVLSGTYPSPGFAVDMATQAELDAEASSRASGDTAAIATAEAFSVQRANHTGTQTISTLSDLDRRTYTNAHGSTINKCQAVYVSSSGQVRLAQADVLSTACVVGLVSDTSIASAASGNFVSRGPFTATTAQWDAVLDTPTSGLVPGTVYYESKLTAGNITATAPVAPDIREFIGVAETSTTMMLD